MLADRSRLRRVLYVEDDPALRGMLAAMLAVGGAGNLEIVAAVGSSAEALHVAATERLSVALLDFSLGDDELNGVELGIRLREAQPDIGIVILSQHIVPDFLSHLPSHYREGWSFIRKRADLGADYLVDVVLATARGLTVVDPEVLAARIESPDSVITRLTARQQQIMALAAQGRDAVAIAEDLHIQPGTVRQELSRAYSVLVPSPTPGTDLRTSAVLRYLRESRPTASGAGA